MAKLTKRPRLTRGNGKSKRKARVKALIVVAHPDDETLFSLGPLLQKTAHRSSGPGGRIKCTDWTIVCATDADGNGEGLARMRLFGRACRSLGAKMVCLGHPDQFDQEIDRTALTQQLQALGSDWTAVYTHGPLGEYGHIHHQNVSLGVHQAFFGICPVWSVSNNVAAELTVTLSRREFKQKTDLLMKYYDGEIRKFLNLIPLQAHEAYNRLSLSQVDLIQRAVRGEVVSPTALGPYAWLYPLLKDGDWSRVAGRFFQVYFSK